MAPLLRVRLAIAAAVLAIDCGSAAAQPLVVFQDERHAFRMSVADLLLQQRFGDLEAKAQALRSERRRFASGAPVLFDFYEGLNPAADGVDRSKRALMAAALQKWKEKAPTSITPRVVLVRLHLSLAWEARGAGWAADVGKRGWRGFEGELQKAWDIGNEALTLEPLDPGIYDALLAVAVGRGLPSKDLENLFADGVQLDPGYDHLYVVMARNLMPRWHGSAAQFERFASEAAERTKGSLGEQLYARIAAEGLVLYGGGDFDQLRPAFQWGRLKKAFTELEKAHPNSSFVLNTYCLVATRYGDVATALPLFDRLTGHWSSDTKEVWGSQQYLEQMRRWAQAQAAKLKGSRLP